METLTTSYPIYLLTQHCHNALSHLKIQSSETKTSSVHSGLQARRYFEKFERFQRILERLHDSVLYCSLVVNINGPALVPADRISLSPMAKQGVYPYVKKCISLCWTLGALSVYLRIYTSHIRMWKLGVNAIFQCIEHHKPNEPHSIWQTYHHTCTNETFIYVSKNCNVLYQHVCSSALISVTDGMCGQRSERPAAHVTWVWSCKGEVPGKEKEK